jgi:sporulation protein YlmC with PRC-barrel domain
MVAKPGMQLAGTVVHRQIIDVVHGSRVGTVHDLYFDTYLSQVTGIFVGYDNMLDRNAGVIKRNDVAVFGQDAILVKHSNVAIVANDPIQFPPLAGWMRREELVGREVGTLEGKRLGILSDLILADKEMTLLGMTIRMHSDTDRRELRTIPISAVRVLTHDRRVIIDLAETQGHPIALQE